MKLGLDYHGCANTHTEVYSQLTQALIDAGHEVHIITGVLETPEVVEELQSKGIRWTHWFSITQYHLDLGIFEVKWVDDTPRLSASVWDKTKAVYCASVGIDLHIDDSPVYGQFFTGKTTYLLQKNPKWQEFWAKMTREG